MATDVDKLNRRLEQKAAELGIKTEEAPVDMKALEVPFADEVVVDLVYGAEIAAMKAAEEMGMERTAHEHELDGRTVFMPGPDHDTYVNAYNELAEESVSQEAAVGQKEHFDEGAAVRWSWDGEPVHGRVAEKRPNQATVSGNTITGDEGEPVYVIDEWDDRVGGFRRENVAKPESSLDESQKDLPQRDESEYVSEQAWDSLTTVVSESDFTPIELDFIADDFDGVLQKSRPNEWLVPDPGDPVVYRADVPDRYLGKHERDLFVPSGGMARQARAFMTDPGGVSAKASGREAMIVEHAERGEPLPVEVWRDISATADGTYAQAERVVDAANAVDDERALTLEGAVSTNQRLSPSSITKRGTNEVDVDALEGELREAVEADDFYIYGKASIEQWDNDDPPTYIQMDALEGALERYFSSETAPGIISRHHQDIPVGKPVREFEFETDTTLEIDGESYEFEAGDTATSHVEDADGDGRPELWLAAKIDNETEMGKKTRLMAAQGDLNGFSVTVHRNRDELTQEGRVVTECDLHATTIGTDDQIKNEGSEFDVASFKGKVKQVVSGILQ